MHAMVRRTVRGKRHAPRGAVTRYEDHLEQGEKPQRRASAYRSSRETPDEQPEQALTGTAPEQKRTVVEPMRAPKFLQYLAFRASRQNRPW